VLLISLILGASGDDLGGNTVLPFATGWVKGTIELVHSDRLGVEHMIVGLDEVLLTGKSSLGSGEYFIASSLTATSGSDNHETMSNYSRIVELEHFLNKGRNGLHVHLL